jgi:hypothetical protein
MIKSWNDITWKNKYLVINSEGQRTCGRSRHGWKDNIEPYGELFIMYIENYIILPSNTNSGFFMLPADMKCGCYKV